MFRQSSFISEPISFLFLSRKIPTEKSIGDCYLWTATQAYVSKEAGENEFREMFV